jgi:hypothetical protein
VKRARLRDRTAFDGAALLISPITRRWTSLARNGLGVPEVDFWPGMAFCFTTSGLSVYRDSADHGRLFAFDRF